MDLRISGITSRGKARSAKQQRNAGALLRLAPIAQDKRGNILPLVAGSLVLIATMIGGGVDASRSYMVKNRLQAACDAATLAGRRAVSSNGYDTAAKAQATSYFNVNFDPDIERTRLTSFSSASTDNGNRVNGTAKTTVDMLIMKLFGYRKIEVEVTCTSTMGVGNSDVTMVLDNTGSMGETLSGTSQTRIQALRAAMKNFYTTVQTATAGSNARIRYSFVPFSSTVNVGALLYNRDPSWLRDSMDIQSRVPVYRTEYTSSSNSPITYSSTVTGTQSTYNTTTYNNNSSGLTSCNNARPTPNPTAWASNGNSSTVGPNTTTNPQGVQTIVTTKTQPQKRTNYLCKLNSSNPAKNQIYKYDETRNEITTTTETRTPVQVFDHFDYKKVSYNTSQFKTFSSVGAPVGTDGAMVYSTWGGCIEERKTIATGSFSYSTLLGMSPSDAFDLDIDTPPDTLLATKWAPMWPTVAFYRTKTTTNSKGVSTTSATNDAVTTQGAQASSYCPRASTTLATMTQTSFNSYADSLVATGSTYHDIGMLWGARLSSVEGIFGDIVDTKPTNGGSVSRHLIYMTDGEPNASELIQQAYGIEYHDRRITSDGVTSDDARHIARFRALCDAVKAKGIRIWVIAFASGMTTDLSYCSSSNSAFTASNSTQLNSAFQEIAKQVGELRVVD